MRSRGGESEPEWNFCAVAAVDKGKVAWTKLTSRMACVEMLRHLATKYSCFMSAAVSVWSAVACSSPSSEASLNSDGPVSDSWRSAERRFTRGSSVRCAKMEMGVVLGEARGVTRGSDKAPELRSDVKMRASLGGTMPEVAAALDETPSLHP